MKVFVTGATGFIGSAVVRELQSAGHTVLGLARSDKSAAALTQMGAEIHRGDLSDVESLIRGAKIAGGVIHLAFNHDWAGTSREEAARIDRRAVEAITGAMANTDKPFVLTSGTAMTAFSFPPGHIGTENDAPDFESGRGVSETVVREAAGRGVRTSSVRLSPTVHGAGDYGFVPMLIDLARRTRVSAYIGDGENRWPAVHRKDAARLFRLALENAAPGTVWHGASEEGIRMREIAETIGAGLGVPVQSVGAEEAKAHFDWLSGFVGMDNPTASAITRETLGWNPQEITLLADMQENYFV